jgi:hypothetical protein
MEDEWRPARATWTDADGVEWSREHRRWLTEGDARRLVLRDSTIVAIERFPDQPELQLLEHAVRRTYWHDHVKGHFDDGTGGPVPANGQGVVYRGTSWTDDQGRRLVLLSEIC